MGTAYAQALGARLRDVRRQQGLSLHDVEHLSGRRLRASVVGAYERGERAVSMPRLRLLSAFYRVPVAHLLPASDRRADRREGSSPGRGVRVDLTALPSGPPEAEVVVRYLRTIQSRRGDYNGRVLTVRDDDLRALAAVLDTRPDDLRRLLAGSPVGTPS